MSDRVEHKKVSEVGHSPREPLSEEAVESVAAWLRVIAEPMRIRLMEILNAGSSSVQGLSSRLGTSRQNVSKHLCVLHRAGIVRRRKAGNHTLYELADFSGWWMIEQAGRSVSAELDDRRSALRNYATA